MNCYNFKEGNIKVMFSRDGKFIQGIVRIKRDILQNYSTKVKSYGFDIEIISDFSDSIIPEEFSINIPRTLIRTKGQEETCTVILDKEKVRVYILFKEYILSKSKGSKQKNNNKNAYYSKKSKKRSFFN